MLQIDQLRFSFPPEKSQNRKKAKDNSDLTQIHPMEFSLEVASGEILSVIGPSGSGKTTLLNLIAGFLKPTTGTIRINDQDISQREISQRPVTTVFQENNLFPHLDVFTNVAIGIQPSLKLSESETQAIHHALKNVGLSDLSKRQPKELSGGQRQRVALARALVRKHSILLLDEPLAALGPAMRDEIIDLLKELVETNKMSALLISHQPEDALKASSRTAFIEAGRILTIGDSKRLLNPETPESSLPQVLKYLGNM